MDRRAGHRVGLGFVVAAGAVGIAAAAMTLSGFRGSGSGDLVVSSAMQDGLSLALALFASLGLLFLGLVRLPSRRRSGDAVPPAVTSRGTRQPGPSARSWRARRGPR